MTNPNITTISATFTREQFLRLPSNEHAGRDTKAGEIIADALRQRGIPIIGHIGTLAVEWGKLTIAHEEGLDGDEWTYTWTGVPVPADFVKRMNSPNGRPVLAYPLMARIRDAEIVTWKNAQASVDDEL